MNNELKSALMKAGEAALSLDAAKAATEAAKEALERAKASFDDAKAAEAAAKAELDGALQSCEERGLSKAKARKAADAINQAFADAGIARRPGVRSRPRPGEEETVQGQGRRQAFGRGACGRRLRTRGSGSQAFG